MLRPALRPLFALSLLVAQSGCGSAADEPAPGGTEWSESGSLRGTFTFSPSPPIVGKNSLDAELADKEDAPLTGATVAIEPWMAAHGHGTSVTPVVAETSAGVYHASDIVFEMPGQWELRIKVTAGGIQDRFVLSVPVQ